MLSPMMQQYFDVKTKYDKYLLFYRVGDFYEMFFDDAKLASRELELTLTGKDCGLQERAPMCGVPHHSCDAYIARLIAKGYKVAICEQTEDPATAKGLVKRDVVRVVTPGTITEESMLPDAQNNFLGSIFWGEKAIGIAVVDVSTGTVYATETVKEVSAVADELSRFVCSEIIINPNCPPEFIKKLEEATDKRCEFGLEQDYTPKAVTGCLMSNFPDCVPPEDFDAAKTALCAAVGYVYDVYKGKIQLGGKPEWYSTAKFLSLDQNARRNLEIYTTMRRNERKGSLIWVLDRTKTAMGRRMLTEWVQCPLMDCAKIMSRQNAVAELVEKDILCSELSDVLAGICDIERAATRICCETANARDLVNLAGAIEKFPVIKEKCASLSVKRLSELYAEIDTLADICELIRNAIVDEPPLNITEGGVIKQGYHPDVDHLRNLLENTNQLLLDFEANEREKTGIKQLKVKYNRVFGYGIEITKGSSTMPVPEHYIRRQTLTTGERYVTEELKSLESDITGGKAKLTALEHKLFCEVRKQVAGAAERIKATARAIAEMDVFISLATVAVRNRYCRPVVDTGNRLAISGGRHPVVECISEGLFVPNDVEMDCSENMLLIVTGPNMAGKSTYMRQTALIVVMAQMGSFVPADSAHIGIVDAIFTRVGASDDLAAGQSTFMVEMSELALILKKATSKSLIILDEIGRGTSTFDGMSIAQSTVEYIANPKKIGAKTLFATHYHELCQLEAKLSGVKNYNILVKKRGNEIQFLRKIARGGADESYGIDVSRLAGVPEPVINRAKVILAELESNENKQIWTNKQERPTYNDGQIQSAFDDDRREGLLQKLRNVDVNTLTPLEAITLLSELGKTAREII